MSKVVDLGRPSIKATSVTPQSGTSAVKRLSTLPVRSIVFSKSPALRDRPALPVFDGAAAGHMSVRCSI
jgi:hypothetical protein